MEDLKGKIRVYVRVRPMSKKEKDRGCKEIATKEGKNGIKLTMADSNKQFDFDQGTHQPTYLPTHLPTYLHTYVSCTGVGEL